MTSKKLLENFPSLLYQFYYSLLKVRNTFVKPALFTWIFLKKKLIIFTNIFKSCQTKKQNVHQFINHFAFKFIFFTYQAAIPPSARDSDPPTRTPVFGSRQIICPRPKEFGSSSILMSWPFRDNSLA